MPKIVIKEYDNTQAGPVAYRNFTVAIPGFVNDGKETAFDKAADENGILELSTVKEFEDYIGKVSPMAGETTEEPTADNITHLGNQMAYELLGLGYTVLYKKLDKNNYETQLKNVNFWSPFLDKAIYDFRYIVTGLLKDINGEAAAQICTIASYKNNVAFEDNGRGDCIALVDVSCDAYTSGAGQSQMAAITGIKTWANALNAADKFSTLLAPYVVYNMTKDAEFGNNTTFPASFHYLACATNAFDVLGYDEWFAVAGYTRGVSKYAIDKIGVKLGEAAINALQPRTGGDDTLKRAVNTIMKDRTGYYIWGNRTAHNLNNDDLVASHFLNIRQLCCTLKKQIYMACRKFTFDPNSDVLWLNFVGMIEPLLKRMQSGQGINDYRIIKVKTKTKGVLKVKIRIVPVEAVEDFDISVYLEDSVNGAKVAVEEADESTNA